MVALTLAGVYVAMDAPRVDAPPPAPDAGALTVVDAGPTGAAPAEPATTPAAAHGVFTGELQRSQTLTAALEPHGATTAQVLEIVGALRGVYDFRSARPGSPWRLEMDPERGEVRRFVFEHGPLDVYEVVRGEDGELVGRQVEVPVRVVEAEVGAEIRASLYNAMQRAGEGAGLVALIVDVFAWDLDFFKDQHPGDRFKVIVEKLYKDEDFVRYGRILAAEYEGKKGTFRTFWYEPAGGTGGYYLEDGQSARKTFLATPLKYGRISSGFSKKRKHPILGYTKAHLAIDYAAPRGTPVWAMAPGKISFAGRKGPNGNLVVIDHGRGLKSYYAHLHTIRRGVKRGVRVEQKQLIGTVGSTGRSTGPHLHFAVKQNGKPLNPLNMKAKRGDPIAPAQQADFAAAVKRRLDRLGPIRIAPAPLTEEDPG